jgi:tetratricopeptide (TPR) repeat protein
MRPLLACVAILVVAGCNQEQPKTAATEPPAPAPMSGQPPMASQQPDADDAAKLADAEKSYTKAKAAYNKNSKDAKVKKAYIDATVKYGHESMMTSSLSQRVKYRQALALYREALKLDPKNEVAVQESQLIIGIYKQMGRPIPE